MDGHRQAGVEVVAVTDHNSVDWYPELREAGNAVGVYVFPGIEISVNGCHLIVIWDRNDDGYRLAEGFLQALWAPARARFSPNGDPKPVPSGQVLDIARKANDYGGLVFAPHSTERGMGLFAKNVCRNHSEVAQSGLVLGFDVHGNTKADVIANPRSAFGDIPPRWFLSGDVRALDQIGKRATYLKMAPEPTLEGIHQAFLMHETRVRFPRVLKEQWHCVSGAQFLETHEPSWPRFTSIAIDGGFHSDLQVDLAPGLNAIIGGKGTGKSTLIEIMRYAIDAQPAPLPDGDANRRANFTANAEARIGIVDARGESYAVHRSGDGMPARLLRDGGEDAGVEVGRRFVASVFGQKELQELANRNEVLREFVASHAGSQWSLAVTQESDLVERLRSADVELGAIEEQLSRMEDDAAELADTRERLLTAEEKGAAALIAESSVLGEADRAVSHIVAWPSVLSTRVDALDRELPVPRLANHPLLPKDLEVHAKALGAAVGRTVSELRTVLRAAVADMKIPSSVWEQRHRDERHRIQSALADAGITDPEELERLQHRAAELTELVESRSATMGRHDELMGQRSGMLAGLADVRRLKSRLTENAARALSGRVGVRVRISTSPLADRSRLLGILEQALSGQSVRQSQLQHLVTSPPPILADAMREGAEAVEALGCTGTTALKVAALAPSVVRACEESDVPDQVTVEIDLGAAGAENWMPVKDVSPGQRATALLALVLASETKPLVIDQPEDDLDNRYIYDEVVKVLGEVCSRRQVIVATHNANVAVLGDAELVLALDAQSDRSRVIAIGGLESLGVAETARKILEGGDEAFQARYRRYSATTGSLDERR